MNEVIADTGVQPALTVTDGEVAWDATHDVLVIGFGAAGASAAIEAATHGADVAIIDRFTGGGSTALSGSVYYAGGGTALQQRLGLEDDAENMYRYLKFEVGDVVGDETLRRFCNESATNFDWIEQHGVKFPGGVFTIKTTHPRPEYSLYYSGNELLNTAIEKTGSVSVPRGHVADGNAKATGLGSGFFKPLGESALRKASIFYPQSRVRRLFMNESGEVIGVELCRLSKWSVSGVLHRGLYKLANLLNMASPSAAGICQRAMQSLERRSEVVRIKAKQGVILSAGGFIFNRSMVAEHLPAFLIARTLGQAGDNGAGIALGVSAGGVTDHMGNASSWRFINPPKTWPKGIIVNRDGRRFCNESSYGSVIGTAMYRDNGGEGFLLIDQALYEKSTEYLSRDARSMIALFIKAQLKRAVSADSMAELAAKLGVDEEGLAVTVRAYNLAASGAQPDSLGKAVADMAALVTPPFYAIDIAGDGCPSLSLGGLVVDEISGQVKTKNSKPIKGLYAAGRTAVGVASNNYVSGLSIADGVFSGRRAGMAAALGRGK